jgi:hypothetical protein
MANAPNNATVVEACTRRIRALGAYVDGRTTIGIDGRKHAHADVVDVYRRCLDARAKVANLRVSLERDRAFRSIVTTCFGPS